MANTGNRVVGESESYPKSWLLMRKSFLSLVYGIVAILLIGVVPCPVMGQALAKKQLMEADYSLWGTMGGEQISAKGKWASYRMSYENNVDTLFVVNTQTLQHYTLAGVRLGQFNGEQTFAYIKKEVLVLVDLATGKESQIPAVERYDFSADEHCLITMEKGSQLVVRKYGQVIDRIANVTEYTWDDASNTLLYTTRENGEGAVGYLTLEGNYSRRSIIPPKKQTFKTLKWQHKGKKVSFFGVNEGLEELYSYDIVSGKLHVLKSTDTNFPVSMKISPDQNVELTVSRDGKKVFFGITPVVATDTTTVAGAVEIWNAKDKMMYPRRMLLASVRHPQYLTVWYPERNVVRQISTEEQPWVMLNGNQEYALVAAPLKYEPQYKLEADMDYYLVALESGKRELLLKEQSGFMDHMGISPDGRYINYYKESNWWVYDIKLKTHTNVTKGLDVSWDNRATDPGNQLNVWGQPRWTTDDQWSLYYDYHDIWAISPDGLKRKRLTRGKEKQLRFRFDPSAISDQQSFNYLGIGIYQYDISKRVLLKAHDLYGGATGYYLLQPNKGVVPVAMDSSAISNLQKAKESEAFVYFTQRFDRSPTLMFRKGIDKPMVILKQSNSQQELYQWGKSEMIHYTDSKGRLLNGALFYPAGYDSTKRYPMVVYIYEIVSHDVNSYVNPTIHNTLGFNITNLTTSGYAVLLADIAFEKGNTGFSAVDCVTKAVNTVVEMGVADVKRLGLMGHSFGGYETNFIITQTNLFAAAISGAGVSDTMGQYFNFNTIYKDIDGWRYENQQYRMGFSFFENQEAYYRNSPLCNVKRIATPLLTWAGVQDNIVQPKQAATFYAALRRLQMEHVMLVYPNDGHIFYNPKNQEDITRKMQDWLGYYLKGGAKAVWMKGDSEE
jgi:dipeptidyl aminopeptidase/acylaminoacyl peptidase